MESGPPTMINRLHFFVFGRANFADHTTGRLASPSEPNRGRLAEGALSRLEACRRPFGERPGGKRRPEKTSIFQRPLPEDYEDYEGCFQRIPLGF